jgi:hypothetical protein
MDRMDTDFRYQDDITTVILKTQKFLALSHCLRFLLFNKNLIDK